MPPVLGRIQNAVVLALITAGIAMLLALSPVARMMEEELGLSWLFTLRGPLPPPAGVAIVSLDRQSARRLGLPPQVRLWPRSLRANLINELKKRGATAIAIDLTLETPTDQIQDGALTRAISASRSVVLVEALEREEVAVTDAQGNPAGHMAILKAVPPIEPFAKAAAALAPFPLPKISARTSQFWAFKEGAGDRLTLPAAALQVHAAPVHAIWLSRLREADVPGLETLPPDNDLLSEPGSIQRASLAVRRAFLQDPGLAERLPPLPARLGERERRLIDALDRLHTGPQHYYLNLYGPASTIPVISFADLIEGKPVPDLTGRAVFVGVAERSSTNVDSFYTVFTTSDGIDISGVEIAATAFANLLDDTTLKMPGQASGGRHAAGVRAGRGFRRLYAAGHLGGGRHPVHRLGMADDHAEDVRAGSPVAAFGGAAAGSDADRPVRRVALAISVRQYRTAERFPCDPLLPAGKGRRRYGPPVRRSRVRPRSCLWDLRRERRRAVHRPGRNHGAARSGQSAGRATSRRCSSRSSCMAAPSPMWSATAS